MMGCCVDTKRRLRRRLWRGHYGQLSTALHVKHPSAPNAAEFLIQVTAHQVTWTANLKRLSGNGTSNAVPNATRAYAACLVARTSNVVAAHTSAGSASKRSMNVIAGARTTRKNKIELKLKLRTMISMVVIARMEKETRTLVLSRMEWSSIHGLVLIPGIAVRRW